LRGLRAVSGTVAEGQGMCQRFASIKKGATMPMLLGRRGVIAGAGAVVLPSFAAAQPAGPAAGRALVMLGATTRHVNPAIQSGTPAGIPGTQIFASPLRYDDKWNPQPYLAERWTLGSDGKSLTLYLAKNAVFHDGAPVTSADVAFTIDVIKKHHPFTTMLEPVVDVETPDDKTAVIRLSHPHPALMLAMSPALCPILPKHIYGDGRDIMTHPANTAAVGAGPFRITEFKPGEVIRLERFDKFFLPDKPRVDKIVMHMITDPQTTLLALERKEIAYIPYVSTIRDADRLTRQPDLQVTDKGFEGIGALIWIAFNCAKKPLDDKRVRQAIAYLSDRPRMLKVLDANKVKPAFTPIHPGSPFYTTDVNHFDFNADKANALLDEAGYPRGADGTRFKLTIDYDPGPVEVTSGPCEFMRGQLKRAGIEVDLRGSPDFPTWASRVSNFDFDLTMDAVFNWGDPVIGVHRTYLTRNIRKGVIWSNTQSYSNPKVDALLDAAAIEGDPAKRKDLYREFQQIVVEDVPILFLHAAPYAQAGLKGMNNLPTTIWGPMSPYDELTV
jgi:peptide/nickel transport system substrate-binding protein